MRPAILHAADVAGMGAACLIRADADLDQDPSLRELPVTGAGH